MIFRHRPKSTGEGVTIDSWAPRDQLLTDFNDFAGAALAQYLNLFETNENNGWRVLFHTFHGFCPCKSSHFSLIANRSSYFTTTAPRTHFWRVKVPISTGRFGSRFYCRWFPDSIMLVSPSAKKEHFRCRLRLGTSLEPSWTRTCSPEWPKDSLLSIVEQCWTGIASTIDHLLIII